MTLTELKQAVANNDCITIHIVDLQLALSEIAVDLEDLLGAVDAGLISPLENVNRLIRLLNKDIGA